MNNRSLSGKYYSDLNLFITFDSLYKYGIVINCENETTEFFR